MFTLLVMAAGLGSRFGGTKQLAAVGPNNEAFLDFAIADARAAGAHRVVLIVRRDIKADVARHLETGGRLPDDFEVAYVYQDEHGPPRSKPWGTAHAVLSAAEALDGPFVVCNADDYYGPQAYTALAQVIGPMADNEAWLCGYRLGHTLPAHGSVTRGVCQVTDQRLTTIVEHAGVTKVDGVITSTEPPVTLADDATVSMNLWAFSPHFLSHLDDGFARFLTDHRHDPNAEYLLPHAVAQQIDEGLLSVGVVTTNETWIGVTNREDLAIARAALADRAPA